MIGHIYRQLRSRRLLNKLRSNLNQVVDSEVEPIFIIGADRTGSTLLARLIHEHGGCYFPPENFTLSGIPGVFIKNQSKKRAVIVVR